jgi:hypothetical protein
LIRQVVKLSLTQILLIQSNIPRHPRQFAKTGTSEDQRR